MEALIPDLKCLIKNDLPASNLTQIYVSNQHLILAYDLGVIQPT